LAAQGATTETVISLNGQDVSHDDVHEIFEAAYKAHREEFAPQKMGAKSRYYKKLKQSYQNAVKDDVIKKHFGISGWTIGFAVILGILGGPVGLLIAIVVCLFEYYFTKDLDGDQQLAAAMA
jgi:hypothetical protein